MITFNLDHYKKVRIWFEDMPILKMSGYGTERIKNYECKKTDFFDCHNKELIVEAFLPRGARVIYGLLGIKYECHPSTEKIIARIITGSKSKKEVFINSLLEPIEHAYVGIAEEYLDYIENGIDHIYKEGKLCLNGQVDFCYASHGIVSSNGWIFEKLSYLLLSLLQIDKNQITSELLIKLLS